MKMKTFTKLTLGAVAALSLAGPTYAQDTTTTVVTTTTVTPVPISGTVLRYYVDRAGFVSAMDVQTADGIRNVRFSPSMAQKLNTLYPVGTNMNGYVTTYTTGRTTNYYLAGATATMPVPGAAMLPDGITDIDILKSVPYTTVGAKLEKFSGKVTGWVSAPHSGEVLALIVDDTTLVRVPAESRLMGPINAPEGIRPIYGDSRITGYGYPEAPRWGSISPFSNRIIATALSIDGHAVGVLGFGKVGKSKYGSKAIAGAMSEQELAARKWGYYTYSPTVATP
jgi:hypothetical protein